MAVLQALLRRLDDVFRRVQPRIGRSHPLGMRGNGALRLVDARFEVLKLDEAF
jgi:hypothetical protein